MDINYDKYLKYKTKYFKLLEQIGGVRKRGKDTTQRDRKRLERFLSYDDSKNLLNIQCIDNEYTTSGRNILKKFIPEKEPQDKENYCIVEHQYTDKQEGLPESETLYFKKLSIEETKGISQLKGICWFDSIITILLGNPNIRQIVGPYIYAFFNFHINQLNTENGRTQVISEITQFEKAITEKLNVPVRGLKAKELMTCGGSSFILLYFLNQRINTFNTLLQKKNILTDKIKNVETFIFSNYSREPFQLDFDVKECINGYTTDIDKLNLKSDTDMFSLVFTFVGDISLSRFYPRTEIIKDGTTYVLSAIQINSETHAMGYFSLNNEWYFYDDNRALENKPIINVTPHLYVKDIDGSQVLIHSQQYNFSIQHFDYMYDIRDSVTGYNLQFADYSKLYGPQDSSVGINMNLMMNSNIYIYTKKTENDSFNNLQSITFNDLSITVPKLQQFGYHFNLYYSIDFNIKFIEEYLKNTALVPETKLLYEQRIEIYKKHRKEIEEFIQKAFPPNYYERMMKQPNPYLEQK